MNAQAEYEDVCARHEYEFGIHLHHIYIYIYSSIRLEITAKTDNIRIVVQIWNTSISIVVHGSAPWNIPTYTSDRWVYLPTLIDRPRDSANRFNQFTVSSDRSTRENYLQSESQHSRLNFLISVNFKMTSYWAFGFFFWGYNVNIHLYMIHFWNTLTLRKVQFPTDVSRLNCVFERIGDMIPRALLCVLWLPSNMALNKN